MENQSMERNQISEINHKLVTDVIQTQVNYYKDTLQRERELRHDSESSIQALEKEINSLKDMLKQMVWTRDLCIREREAKERAEHRIQAVEEENGLLKRQLSQFQTEYMDKLRVRKEMALTKYKETDMGST